MSTLVFVQFAAGLALLVAGASWLVRGGSGIAARFGVPPLIVGLTIVAFGTSAPEMAVSIEAALSASAAVSVGNVVGSNIFNVLFILGLSALIAPLAVDGALLRRDAWVMLGTSALVPLLAWGGLIGRGGGALLLAGSVVYTWWLVREARGEAGGAAEATERRSNGRSTAACAALVAGGLAALVLGAGWLVTSATTLARAWNVSELVIGLTVVAAGTSLPEVATSLVAAMRGERDIAVGNVVGSNIFNILAVLGAAAMAAPGGLPVDLSAMRVDIAVMVAASAACLPVFFTGGRIDRWEGLLFLGGYGAYAAWLYLEASGADARGAFAAAMLWVVLPLAGALLAASAARSMRGRAGRLC